MGRAFDGGGSRWLPWGRGSTRQSLKPFFLQYGYRTRIQNKTYYELLVCILASMHSNNYICIYTSQYINSPVGAFADYARRAEVSSGRETQPPGEEILASLTGYTLPFVLYFPLVFAILTAVGPEYGPKALPLCVPTNSANNSPPPSPRGRGVSNFLLRTAVTSYDSYIAN